MRLSLLSYSTDNIKAYSELTEKTKYGYCEHYPIDYYNIDTVFNKNVPPFINGFIALQNVLNRSDWVWWLEADAAIMNKNISIYNLVNDNYDLIIGEDENGLNTGSFLIKDTKFMNALLTIIIEQSKDYSHIWPGQITLQNLYQEYEAVRKRTLIIDRLLFNSYEREYKKGDFVLHLPGESLENRVNKFKKYIDE